MAPATPDTSLKSTGLKPPRRPVYKSLSAQVLFAIAVAIVLGYVSPAKAIAMKPLGDAFIRLITMIIALVIFCVDLTDLMRTFKSFKLGMDTSFCHPRESGDPARRFCDAREKPYRAHGAFAGFPLSRE